MKNRAKFCPAKAESAMKEARDPQPAATALRRENPREGWSGVERSQLLRRVEGGQALTLAEYVRAEAFLARSARAGTVRLCAS